MIGLVLAGGKSSRLGQDKTAVVHQGQTLLERTASLLLRHCETVYVSCRHPENVPIGLPVIVDETERIGPAGGIMTALKQCNAPILVLACDLPFMDDHFIARLVAAHTTRPPHCVVTTWLQKETGFIEALVAIYEPQALPLLSKGVAQGCFKLSRLIPVDQRHCIEYEKMDEMFFFNVNYPDDLHKLHKDGPSI